MRKHNHIYKILFNKKIYACTCITAMFFTWNTGSGCQFLFRFLHITCHVCSCDRPLFFMLSSVYCYTVQQICIVNRLIKLQDRRYEQTRDFTGVCRNVIPGPKQHNTGFFVFIALELIDTYRYRTYRLLNY